VKNDRKIVLGIKSRELGSKFKNCIETFRIQNTDAEKTKFKPTTFFTCRVYGTNKAKRILMSPREQKPFQILGNASSGARKFPRISPSSSGRRSLQSHGKTTLRYMGRKRAKKWAFQVRGMQGGGTQGQ